MTHVFRGRTLLEAEAVAERELGSEVIVLHSRRVRRDGVAGLLGETELEITAGVRVPELPQAPTPTVPMPATDDVRVKLSEPVRKMLFATGVYDDEAADSGSASRGDLEKLNAEVRAMRGILHSLKSSPTKIHSELATLRRAVDEIVPTSTPVRLEQLIAKSGLEGPVAAEVKRLLARHDGDDASLVDAFRDALADRVKVRSWPLSSESRKLIGVVGAPGVGKTTTLAKLAARALTEGKTVSFVACDTYRVGAVEQLRRYAALLDSPIDVAKTPEELFSAALKSEADVVLVDTSGRGPEDGDSVEAALANKKVWGDRARHILLCVEASARHADTEDVVGRFRLTGPTSLAVTKVDLTGAPSGLINGTLLANLAVSVLCDGQRVPEDISPATAGRILDLLAPQGSANSRRFDN